MARPPRIAHANLTAQSIGQLWPKPQLMDLMGECMPAGYRALKVIIQIMDMHHSIRETPTRRDVEVPNDFIDAEPALDPTTLLSLCIKLLAIVFPFALLHTIASAKCPAHARVCFPDFLAGLAAA